MAPKKDIVYVKKGKSKFVAPSRRMIIDFDNNTEKYQLFVDIRL